MLGRDHLLIAAALTVPAGIEAVVLSRGELVIPVFVAWAGVAAGALVPDIDAPDAAINYRNAGTGFGAFTALNPFVGFVSGLLIEPSAKLLARFGEVDRGHRGVTHSLPGLSLLTAGWTVIAAAVAYPLSTELGVAAWYLLAYPGGYLLGGLLHLYADSLTRSGIQWLHPLGKEKSRGGIYTKPRREAVDDPFGTREYVAVRLHLLACTGPFAAFLLLEPPLGVAVSAAGYLAVPVLGWLLYVAPRNG